MTPADWLAVVAQCVEQALDARPGGWDGVTIRGSDEAGVGQPCCPNGLLRVEWVDTTPTEPFGAGRCRKRALITVRVSVRRCVTAFSQDAGGSTTGGAPKPEVVVAEQNQIMDDAWTVWTALACCVKGWDSLYGAKASLRDQAFSLLEGCRGSDTFLEIPVGVCCEDPAS